MTETLERPDATGTTPAERRADAWLTAFDEALAQRDVDRAAGMFATESFWRDLVAFSWNLTTVEGREGVRDLLAATLERVVAVRLRPTRPSPSKRRTASSPRGSGSRPPSGRGRGAAAPPREDGEDRAWTFLTTLHELKGHEEPLRGRRPRASEHGADRDRVTWAEHRQREAEDLGSTAQPYVLVVGGGQGGIALGARLRQLGVPALVIDKHDRPGDQWRGRYKSLCLHDPVWYDHLPYLKFPDNWPVFSPKDKIGDWLESYVKVMEVPYWSGTTVATSATYSRAGAGVDGRGRARGHGRSRCAPKHLVLATGMSGKPNVPDVPGHGRLPRRPAPLLGPPRARTPTPGSGSSSSAATTPPSTSAARCGSTTPT